MLQGQVRNEMVYFNQTIMCWASLLLTIFLASCGQPSDLAQQIINTADLNKTEWILSSLNGQPLIANSNITLTFNDGNLGGYGGCNWYGSTYTATTGTLSIGGIGGTQRGCDTPFGVLQQEATYYDALKQVAMYQVVNNRLEMKNRADEVGLVFTQKEQFAMNPADLVGTKWQLHAINQKPLLPNSTISLSFTGADTISGFAGCRGYTGTYEANGDNIRFPSIGMTETECDKGEAILVQEGQYTTDLSEATDYRLSKDQLEIFTAPGHTLLFTSQQ